MKDKYPKAWADFQNWLSNNWESVGMDMKNTRNLGTGENLFNHLSFEMQLGVYLRYLDKQHICVDVALAHNWECSVHTNKIATKIVEAGDRIGGTRWAIEQAFKIREEQLGNN